LEAKPFAEAHILLQLSDKDRDKQLMVVNTASNLLRHYDGLDYVDIEVITFGPGVHLLAEDSELAPRVKSLMLSGVRFVVCENTLRTMSAQPGGAPVLLKGVYRVPSSVAHMVSRASQNFVVVRP